jgi:hypothetical protein
MDLDDDDEEGGNALYNYAYVFMPRAHVVEGVMADGFREVSLLIGHTPATFDNLIKTYKAMGMDKDNIAEVQNLVGYIQAMSLRAQLNCDNSMGVCLVKTEVPITAENMDTILQGHQRARTLEAFVRRSRIM